MEDVKITYVDTILNLVEVFRNRVKNGRVFGSRRVLYCQFAQKDFRPLIYLVGLNFLRIFFSNPSKFFQVFFFGIS